MLQPVSIELPDHLVKILDEFSLKGDSPAEKIHQRSALIATALQYYTEILQKDNLHEQIKLGAINRSDRDLQLAEDWFHLEEELCHDLPS
jgi:metal-responsive CopG/Arc/MetJ family transcriptional regulator